MIMQLIIDIIRIMINNLNNDAGFDMEKDFL